jgi:hypothetical protein
MSRMVLRLVAVLVIVCAVAFGIEKLIEGWKKVESQKTVAGEESRSI